MELGAIFLLLLVLGIVALFAAYPFAMHWRLQPHDSLELSTLLAERETTLNALVELDVDNATGKVPADEYSTQRAALIQKGSQILRRLDELQAEQPSPVVSAREAAVTDRLARLVSDEDLEDMLAARRRAAAQAKTAGFCPHCGKPILQADRFCPSCGQALQI